MSIMHAMPPEPKKIQIRTREPGYSQDTPMHAMPPGTQKITIQTREPGYSQDTPTHAMPLNPKKNRRREPSYSWDTSTLMDQKRNADAKARAWVYPGHTDPHDATETQVPRENRKVGAWLEPGHTN